MKSQSLNAVNTATIHSVQTSARHVIGSVRAGGERLVGVIDRTISRAVHIGLLPLSPKLREDLVLAAKEITGLGSRGVSNVTDRADRVIDSVASVATHGVDRVSASAGKFEQVFELGAVGSLTRITMPVAQAANDVAAFIAGKAGTVRSRVAGVDATALELSQATRAARSPAIKRGRRAA